MEGPNIDRITNEQMKDILLSDRELGSNTRRFYKDKLDLELPEIEQTQELIDLKGKITNKPVKLRELTKEEVESKRSNAYKYKI